METRLSSIHRSFVEYLFGNMFEDQINALARCIVLNAREETHLELEGEEVCLGNTLLNTLLYDLFCEQPGNRHVHRTDCYDTVLFFAAECSETLNRFRLVCL